MGRLPDEQFDPSPQFTRRRSRVSLHVQRKVVRAREAALTLRALERFGARVLAVVPCQLVGARKAPVAALPRAAVRLLACNREDRKQIVSRGASRRGVPPRRSGAATGRMERGDSRVLDFRRAGPRDEGTEGESERQAIVPALY